MNDLIKNLIELTNIDECDSSEDCQHRLEVAHQRLQDLLELVNSKNSNVIKEYQIQLEVSEIGSSEKKMGSYTKKMVQISFFSSICA